MRRRPGVSAIQRHKETQQKFSEKRAELEESLLEQLGHQLETFKTHLERFAANHRSEIKRNAQFRKQFQEMCAAIGVDPLASSKGFWSELLGVGDFYYELAVRVVETCMAAAPRTGGLMHLDELQRRLNSGRGHVTLDDLTRAIGKLQVLDGGLSLVSLSDGAVLVQSVPGELSGDHMQLLTAARSTAGCYTPGQLGSWQVERERLALDRLVRDGLAWVDAQTDSGTPAYWFPSLLTN